MLGEVSRAGCKLSEGSRSSAWAVHRGKPVSYELTSENSIHSSQITHTSKWPPLRTRHQGTLTLLSPQDKLPLSPQRAGSFCTSLAFFPSPLLSLQKPRANCKPRLQAPTQNAPGRDTTNEKTE